MRFDIDQGVTTRLTDRPNADHPERALVLLEIVVAHAGALTPSVD